MSLNNVPIPSAIIPEVQAAQPRCGYNTWKWSTSYAPSNWDFHLEAVSEMLPHLILALTVVVADGQTLHSDRTFYTKLSYWVFCLFLCVLAGK